MSKTPENPLTPAQALRVLLEFAEGNQWFYEDQGRDCNTCLVCGWNTKEDRGPKAGLSHRPGCELKQAIDLFSGMSDEDIERVTAGRTP